MGRLPFLSSPSFAVLGAVAAVSLLLTPGAVGIGQAAPETCTVDAALAAPMTVTFAVDGARRIAMLPLHALQTPDPDDDLGWTDPLAPGAVQVCVEWGDGTFQKVISGDFWTHEYPAEDGIRTARIWPLSAADEGSDTGPWLEYYGVNRTQETRWAGFGSNADGDAATTARMIEVASFGDLGIKGFRNAFQGHHGLVAVPDTLPTSARDLGRMFELAGAFDDANVAAWDVSRIERMDAMFRRSVFNRPLRGWDVSSVVTFNAMFESSSFDADVSDWRFGTSPSMDIDGASMFRQSPFNQPLDSWDVSRFTTLESMFHSNAVFDQDIGGWDVSNVTTIQNMFRAARAFDQDLSSWDVSNVSNMTFAFWVASAFNRNLGPWQLKDGVDMSDMLKDGSTTVGISQSCYEATLVGWASGPVVTGAQLGADGRVYFSDEAIAARAVLVDRGWTIVGDGLALADDPVPCPDLVVRTSAGPTDPPSSPGPSVSLSCLPLNPVPGSQVTCTILGGPASAEILWTATASAPFAGQGVMLDEDGIGTFAFTVPPMVPGAPLTVTLEGWDVGQVLTSAGPIPSSVPAGEGTLARGHDAPVLVSLALLTALLARRRSRALTH
jgi:surface protein